MKVSFLEARVPLTKKFTATAKEPYPNAFEFKSHTHVIKSIDHFCALIKQHAALGHCLLKGELQKELNFESRAGSTSPHWTTRWLCFDLDGMSSVPDIETFLAKIGMSDVSYILQWSASYGVNGDFSLRAHVFVLLTNPVAAAAAKIYLKQLNLNLFQSDLSLTKTNVSLRWGLDITTCQNDKLIFITPPQCEPKTIDQFTGERITLIKKATDFYDFSIVSLVSAESLKDLEQQEINRLRRSNNLPDRKITQFKLKEYKGESYLPNPDQATITGMKEERGFVYFNLNGGDSWAYYHPADNPTFIRNFKGEPDYRTSELLPDYWDSLMKAKRQAVASQHKGKIFLGVCDFKSADYYVGWYDENTDELDLNVARSVKQVQDFLANYGQPIPEVVPVWNIVYDPHAPTIDFDKRVINVFRPSVYMRFARMHAKLSKPKPTPTIDRVLTHVVGTGMVNHIFNWLAFAFQTCEATKTALVNHGVPGTGKGVFVNHVLVPLFGASNVAQKRMEELEDKFNGYLENSLICVVDEAQISDSPRAKMIMANLKNQITEPVITIRRMRQSSYEVINRVSFMFNSNKPDPVIVEAGDRRFNVGEYQPDKIQITVNDVKTINAELQDFALRLQQHVVDLDAVRVPLINQAKIEMQMASRTSADVVADALLNGSLTMLWDALPTIDVSALPVQSATRLAPYKQLLEDLITTRRNRLTREELFIIFHYNVGSVPESPHKFTLYLKHHGVTIKDIRVGPKVVKGMLVSWTEPNKWFDERITEIEAETKPKKGLKVITNNFTSPSNNTLTQAQS